MNKNESLNDYRLRTQFMRKDFFGQTLQTSTGLTEKVAQDGTFLPFWGDTVVFKPGMDYCLKLKSLQEKLYDNCGEILSEPLSPEYFHMTLHDLDHVWGCDKRWDKTYCKVNEILDDLEDGEVILNPVRTFVMVNTSIVTGYIPADGRSIELLMNWYRAFERDDLFPAGIHPTFHITLAYFRLGCFETQRLSEALTILQYEHLPSLVLKKKDLVYWRFKDMNYYYEPAF